LLVGGLGVLVLLLTAPIGRWLVHALFPDAPAPSVAVFTLLAAGTVLAMLVQVLQPALLAVSSHRMVAVGWIVGVLAFAAAFALLAEAEIAVVVGRNWHVSWWEWHVLMLVAFVIIAVAAQRSWREERWAGLYTRDTAAGERDVSVLFADLAGFTHFSESHEPAEVTAMLNTYFTDAIPPLVERFGGRVDRLIGDAVMAVFEGDASSGASHAHRAAGAALALQQATGVVAAAHPDWPRFRVGVNSGEANVGILGTGGGRTYTVIGDTVNVASRIEHRAPVGGVAIAAGTRERLGAAAITEPLGELEVAGREAPVEAHLLVGLSGT
ncbi:MAG TPA: adenylate/guanylate cyclase domain-containing protein, partial [Agromyces sp.]|nr:adenylate/guanylate cyclase domain-containing protein [Agromyces sp.]